jgi:hypothetical protein
MKIFALVAVIVSPMLAGCIETGRLATASGNPEITVSMSKKAITSALVNRMLNKGWEIRSSDDYRLVFKRQLDSTSAMLAFGSNYNAIPEGRAAYTFVENPDGTMRVVASLDIVTNPGSQYEQVTPDRRLDDLNTIQSALNELASGQVAGSGPRMDALPPKPEGAPAVPGYSR